MRRSRRLERVGAHHAIFPAMTDRATTVRVIRNSAVALESADDYDELIRRARGKRLVLLSESSHGTREFYAQRGIITRRLIEDLGFDAVTVEADWPDAYQVNRFVRGDASAPTAERALGGGSFSNFNATRVATSTDHRQPALTLISWRCRMRAWCRARNAITARCFVAALPAGTTALLTWRIRSTRY